MRIILNSDVLYGDFSKRGLPASLIRLGEACAEQRHVLVIPTTAFLEVDQHQRDIVANRRRELEQARQTLVDCGIDVSDVDMSDVFAEVDIRALLSEVAVPSCDRVATSDGFEDAQARACARQSPCPPKKQSDEMRDLVIWAIAVRISVQDGHALLVSKDEVHTHERGNLEAAGVGLARVDSLDGALEYLEVKTPAGEQLEALIKPSWARLGTRACRWATRRCYSV